MKRNLLIKQEIRHKTKRITDTNNDEQRRAIIDQGKTKVKNVFEKRSRLPMPYKI